MGQPSKVVQALRSWRALIAHLPTLDDTEVEEAIRIERAGRKRKSVLERLIKRATRLSEISASQHYKEFAHARTQDDEDGAAHRDGRGA